MAQPRDRDREDPPEAGRRTPGVAGGGRAGAGAAPWARPLVDAIDQEVARRIRQDPFQRDPRAVAEHLPYMKAACRYHGTRIHGWENLPAEGPFLVVGNHSGGAETHDAAHFMARWVETRGPEAPLYALTYDLLFAYPVVGPLLPRLGMVPASHANARRALERSAAVLVFPGGDHEVFRPWTRRNHVDFGGRKGFVRLALETGVPVVPMTIHGAHQSTFVLTRGRGIARALGLGRLNVKVFPLVWNIPLGITPAWVPSLPLPSRVTVEIGEPFDWSCYGPERAGDPVALEHCYREITGAMESTLRRLAARHPFPVLERLVPGGLRRRLLGRGGRSEPGGRGPAGARRERP